MMLMNHSPLVLLALQHLLPLSPLGLMHHAFLHPPFLHSSLMYFLVSFLPPLICSFLIPPSLHPSLPTSLSLPSSLIPSLPPLAFPPSFPLPPFTSLPPSSPSPSSPSFSPSFPLSLQSLLAFSHSIVFPVSSGLVPTEKHSGIDSLRQGCL